jgi:hypothetical protein
VRLNSVLTKRRRCMPRETARAHAT